MSFRALAVLAVGFLLAGCRTLSQGAPAPATPAERFSYGIGARLGGDLRRSEHEIDPELVRRGFEDGLAGRAVLSDTEIAAALEEGLKQQRERRQALLAEIAQKAEKEGRAFLAHNRERPGVVELASGLQYEVLREGSGPAPGSEDFVTCSYRGTLLDGTVFDDTAERGAPSTFAVTSVIDGFEEALLRMPTGSRWKLYVPAELAYGSRGYGSKIPPNSTLVFEVELLSVAGAPTD